MYIAPITSEIYLPAKVESFRRVSKYRPNDALSAIAPITPASESDRELEYNDSTLSESSRLVYKEMGKGSLLDVIA